MKRNLSARVTLCLPAFLLAGAINLGGQPGPPAFPSLPANQETMLTPEPRRPVELFQSSALPESTRPIKRRNLLRQRMVEVDPEALAAWRPATQPPLRLHLFGGQQVSAILEGKDTRGPRSCSLRGRLSGDDLGSFSFVIHQDAVAGVIRLPRQGRVFLVDPIGKNQHVLIEIDPAQEGVCGVQDAAWGPQAPGPILDGEAAPPPPPILQDSFPCDTDDGSVIKVLILYTEVARTNAGGVARIEARVQLAVDEANQAYANSQITPRVVLAHTREVDYDEDGTYQQHLDRLTNPSDGVMDSIHAWRDEYEADAVSLFVEDEDFDGGLFIQGLAHLMLTSFQGAGVGFSIVNWRVSASNWTFAHELGHNQGCAHDRANATIGYYAYSHGWRFTGNSGTEYRTVMAYAPGTRIAYFSNPSVTFDGQPTGNPDVFGVGGENNAKTINFNARVVANWGRGPTWVDFDYLGVELGCEPFPFNTLAEGVNAVVEGGRVIVRAGATSEKPRLEKRLRIEAASGVVTVGQ